MHDIALNAKEDIPAYLSILSSGSGSPFSDNKIQFVNLRLGVFMLDPDRPQICEGHTTLRVPSL